MGQARRKPEIGRGERILPGVWRLRLPLPWPGVPHGNAFAVAAGDGIVLFDTGMASDDGMRQLEIALARAGWRVEDVQLVVCTRWLPVAGELGAPILERAGCELWMHPAWGHIRAIAEDPDAAWDRRIEVARQSGVPQKALELYEQRRGSDPGIAALVEPDRELLPGVEVETDLGAWQVHETPGHAPSHVVLHQPESGLMISGDHLLGRISLFFDYGHTPDPVGEFISGLDEVDRIEYTTLTSPGTDVLFATSRRRWRQTAPNSRSSSTARAPASSVDRRRRSRSSATSSVRRTSAQQRQRGVCSLPAPTSITW